MQASEPADFIMPAFGFEPGGARVTVLAVDDDPTTLEAVVASLQASCRVLTAVDGLQALHLAAQQRPDLILLDVMLPDCSGYDVCRKLKRHAATRDIPVIFVTARSDEQYEATGFLVGGVDYITKPIRPFILQARVKTHVELKRKGDRLRHLATRDPLTDLANRRVLDEFLQQEWNRAVRMGASPLSVILIDIDHFKAYNDFYGHLAGDEALRAVSTALQAASERRTDLVARFGGEEFICVLPSTPLQGAMGVAQRIRGSVTALRIPHARSDCALVLTVSGGVASTVPERSRSVDWLIGQADRLLYEAKGQGRNQIVGHAFPDREGDGFVPQ